LNQLHGIDHIRAKNNPPIPSAALGKIDLFLIILYENISRL